MNDWKMTDKSAAGKNVGHVMQTFKTNRLIYRTNVRDLGVSVNSA